MATIEILVSDLTGEPINPDTDRLRGRLSFTSPDGTRVEARFDIAEGEQSLFPAQVLEMLRPAKAPGPAKGTPRPRSPKKKA